MDVSFLSSFESMANMQTQAEAEPQEQAASASRLPAVRSPSRAPPPLASTVAASAPELPHALQRARIPSAAASLSMRTPPLPRGLPLAHSRSAVLIRPHSTLDMIEEETRSLASTASSSLSTPSSSADLSVAHKHPPPTFRRSQSAASTPTSPTSTSPAEDEDELVVLSPTDSSRASSPTSAASSSSSLSSLTSIQSSSSFSALGVKEFAATEFLKPGTRTSNLLHAYDSYASLPVDSQERSRAESSISAPWLPTSKFPPPISATSSSDASTQYRNVSTHASDISPHAQSEPLSWHTLSLRDELPPYIVLSESLTTHASRFFRNFAKGMLFGFGGKCGFALLGLLIKFRLNVLTMWRRRGAQALSKSLIEEPLRYGSMLGGMLAIFHTFSRAQPQPYAISTTIISCMLLSPTILLLPRSHRASVVTFFFIRAVECTLRLLAARHDRALAIAKQLKHQSTHVHNAHHPNVAHQASIGPASANSPLSSQTAATHSLPAAAFASSLSSMLSTLYSFSRSNAETIVFCLSSAPICWSALFDRQCLDPSYLSFLQHHSGKSESQLSVFAHLHEAYHAHDLPHFPAAWSQIQRQRSALSLHPLPITQSHVLCHVIHPGMTCTVSHILFFYDAFLRALPVYMPVYLIPLLLFRSRSLWKDSLNTAVRIVGNITRSSLFLATYCSFGWTWLCASRHCLSSKSEGEQWHAVITGLLSGLAILIEKPSRRVELCLYLAGHGLMCFYQAMILRGVLPNFHYGLIPVFGGSLAAILLVAHSSLRRQALRGSYQSIIKYFFNLKPATPVVPNKADSLQHALPAPKDAS